MASRSGIGYDVHPLVEGRELVLGGVPVPFEWGLAGHSDGDVLVHAVIDAMLGAAALGDIGSHFPSSDQHYHGVASTRLLKETVQLLDKHRWRTTFVDATILAERPVLRPFINRMRASLTASLGLELSDISIKATTTDGLGFVGRGEGIGALAIATIEQV